MVILYILGGIILLFLLLLLIPLGVRITFGEELEIRAVICHIPITILPKKEKKAGKKKEKEEAKAEKPEKPKKAPKKKLPKLTLDDVRGAVSAVGQSLGHGFSKIGRKIRIDPMTVCVIFGGRDPADTAKWYGWASSAMWAIMPKLQETLRIPDPQIHLEADFNAEKTSASGTLGIRCRIGGLVAIGFAFAGPLLKWFTAFKKKSKAALPKEAASQTDKTDQNNQTAA